MGLLNDTINSIGREPPAPSAAFDPKRPNHKGYADVYRMELRVVSKANPTLVLAKHRFAAAVANVTRTPLVRQKIHATAGGFIVDMPEIDAAGLVFYQIQGTTGVWPDGAPNHTAATAIESPLLDGMGKLKELSDLITEYLSPDPYGFPRSEVRLEFYNPDEPVSAADPAGDSSYIVVPNGKGVITSRNSKRPALWDYTLGLIAFDRPRSVPVLQQLRERQRAWWEEILGILEDLNAYSFDQMFARYQLFVAPLTRASTILGDVRRNIESYSNGVQEFTSFHEDMLSDFVDEVAALTVNIDETLGLTSGDQFSSDGTVLRDMEATRLGALRLARGIGADPGAQTRAATDASSTSQTSREHPDFPAEPPRDRPEPPLVQAQRRAYRPPADGDKQAPMLTGRNQQFATRDVKVRPGDGAEDFVPTGFTLATIVQMNALKFPFVDGSRTRPASDPLPTVGTPRVAYIDETISVPVLTGSKAGAAGAAQATSRDPRVTPDERLFGVDMWINPETRNLELDPAMGDVRLVGGEDNLTQAITSMFKIRVGDLHTAPTFGNHIKESGWATEQDARFAAIAGRRTLGQDARVERIRELNLTVSGGVTTIKASIDAINSRPVGPLSMKA